MRLGSRLVFRRRKSSRNQFPKRKRKSKGTPLSLRVHFPDLLPKSQRKCENRLSKKWRSRLAKGSNQDSFSKISNMRWKILLPSSTCGTCPSTTGRSRKFLMMLRFQWEVKERTLVLTRSRKAKANSEKRSIEKYNKILRTN